MSKISKEELEEVINEFQYEGKLVSVASIEALAKLAGLI